MSSEDQSNRVSRGRGFQHRRIPVCETCLHLLDAVVAEWDTVPLPGGAARCSTCGGEASVLVDPSPQRAGDVSVDIDVTGPGVLVRVVGGLNLSGLEIVVLEIERHAAREHVVIVDVCEAVLVGPVTVGMFVREVRRAAGGGGQLGLVIQHGRLSQFAGDIAERAGWVVADSRDAVRLLLANRPVTEG